VRDMDGSCAMNVSSLGVAGTFTQEREEMVTYKALALRKNAQVQLLLVVLRRLYGKPAHHETSPANQPCISEQKEIRQRFEWKIPGTFYLHRTQH